MYRFDVKFSESVQKFHSAFKEIQTLTESEYEHYKGSYDITPLFTAQIMPTRDKIMDDNVRIDMIPTREEINATGGVTFVIGG